MVGFSSHVCHYEEKGYCCYKKRDSNKKKRDINKKNFPC